MVFMKLKVIVLMWLFTKIHHISNIWFWYGIDRFLPLYNVPTLLWVIKVELHLLTDLILKHKKRNITISEQYHKSSSDTSTSWGRDYCVVETRYAPGATTHGDSAITVSGAEHQEFYLEQ